MKIIPYRNKILCRSTSTPFDTRLFSYQTISNNVIIHLRIKIREFIGQIPEIQNLNFGIVDEVYEKLSE